MTLSRADAAAFAAASRDSNPLHTDDEYARRTPYGTVLAHGALVVTSALADVPEEALQRPADLNVLFSTPLHLDVPCEVETDLGGDRIRITVRCYGDIAVAIRLEPGPERLPPSTPAGPASDHRLPPPPVSLPAPRVWAVGDLQPGIEFSEEYAPDLPGLRALAQRHGAGQIPDALLVSLAWSSWVVGMQVPGRDSLFAGAALTVNSAGGHSGSSRSSRIQVRHIDARTGSVTVRAALRGPEGSAEAELRTFLRAQVPTITRASVAAELAPSTRLAGRSVLVSGGSRGLGAALTGAFASQGAVVWSLFARSERKMAALCDEFGRGRVRPVQCDVTDAGQLAAAVRSIAAEDVVLDGVMLSASPSVRVLGTGPEAVPAIADFVNRSLTAALAPLTATLPLVGRDHGWLMLASSEIVSDPPEGWGHYAAAKSALESYVTYCGQKHRLPALLLRAPKMHTDMVNGPTGSIQAMPAERVASAVVGWVLGREESADRRRAGESVDEGVTILDRAGIQTRAGLAAPVLPEHAEAGR